MGNKDDKKNIANDDLTTSTDILKETPEKDDDYIVTVKNDTNKADDTVTDEDTDFSLNAEDLSKELDRVESIDTGSLSTKPIVQPTDDFGEGGSEFEEETPVDTVQSDVEMTRPLDLESSLSEIRAKSPKDMGLATVDTALNSHHSFQKQHQKRRILQVFVLLFILATIAASAAAGYLYYQLTEANNQVSQIDNELAQMRTEREKLQMQINDQATQEVVPDSTVTVVDELGIQYPTNDSAADLVYGYGGSTSEGVVFVHYTTRTLADYQEIVGGKQTYPCGIGVAAPVTIVRGTQAQLSALAATRPLAEQRQIGEFFYALSKPAQACSATQSEPIQAAQTAVETVFKTFEAAAEVDKPETSAAAPMDVTRTP